MNSTEKIVIKTIINNLRNSAKTKWTTGDINVWADYAKTMKYIIQTSANILENLTKDETSEDSSETDVTTDVTTDVKDIPDFEHEDKQKL